ncbi:MAG: S49 family peptidase [Chloroflexi bacterium]|nr:S49 family peptidase [Chloroflexota bacterium]
MSRFSRFLAEVIGRVVTALVLIGIGLAAGYGIYFRWVEDDPKIGIIDIPFTVISDDSATFIVEMIDFAREDDSIKGVVIKLNSPGGGVAASEKLFFETERLRREKPVIISVADLAASGGYMMSIGANEIIARPGSFVGSIGVLTTFGSEPPPSETLVGTGPAKLTGGAPRTFLAQLELIKKSFIENVVTQRGDALNMSRDEIAEARIYTGMEALRLGLIDSLGTDSDAIERAAKLAGISDFTLVNVNVEALRLRVQQFERVFGTSLDGDGEVRLQVDTLARAFSGPQAQAGVQRGVPPDFPIDVEIPQFFYLYVAPTQ